MRLVIGAPRAAGDAATHTFTRLSLGLSERTQMRDADLNQELNQQLLQ
jgi:hypothetical protein